MNLVKHLTLVTAFLFGFLSTLFAQSLPAGYPVLSEQARRNQLIGKSSDSTPAYSYLKDPELTFQNNWEKDFGHKIKYGFVPLRTSLFGNTVRPYWYSPNGMIPGKGMQLYLSGGGYISHKYFQIEFQPEMNFAQNSSYLGIVSFNNSLINYLFKEGFRRGDQPETYGEVAYSRIGFGQSKIVGKLGAFELGGSTRNLWWGPGQWNALTFSNNAPGFVHGVLGTHRPAKTFFGSFEFQLISGFPKSKKYSAIQDSNFNEDFNLYLNRNRYLNGLNISISPKWIKGLSIGAARTVQTFTDSVSVNRFIDIFPVFWGITKESVGSDLVGESDRGRDQQITVFFRQVIPKAGLEFYGEFGRRDHALNVRDLVLSPAHSRAYLLGFNKVFKLPDSKLIQIGGEITQQAQSVNWITRASSTTPWHTNGTIGGFTNWDQAMGVGVGLGANIQIMELSLVEDSNKIGLYLERREPFADFYDTADLAKNGYQPWIDFTAGPIFDHQWKNLIFSGRMLFTYASNYYWSQDLGSQSGVDFPIRQNKFSTSTQVNLIYLFNKD